MNSMPRKLLSAFALILIVLCFLRADDEGGGVTPPNNKCCAPPYGGWPAYPVGAVSDCAIDPNNPALCQNVGLMRCKGKASEMVYNGRCNYQDKTTCNDNAGTQSYPARNGSFSCKTAPLLTLCCVWIADDPETTVPTTVPVCSGDPCN